MYIKIDDTLFVQKDPGNYYRGRKFAQHYVKMKLISESVKWDSAVTNDYQNKCCTNVLLF